ncbi:TonB-dependent receptor [Opitutus sp. ER46]|uniref:TonB-dependent siderophore receptor n=1 Tax=Opitutus sp. ER46 TaxID=2161864 RepID=UPI000D3275AB|nr:TonB-dependent receptor [Opitutus sp. ER46]PTX95817.1 TonB-dependent receptor [Opitutus sp. ER46]
MKNTLHRTVRCHCIILTGLLAAFGANALSAQAAPPGAATRVPAASDDEIVTLSQFTVSGSTADRYRAADAISAVRVRAPLLDTPSSISVVTRDMIDDLAPSRIFDAARYVSGVQDGRGMQFQDRMILRGFESNGQRTVDNFLQPADADNIDEAVVDRIEVAKGPNAILSPSGAPGGAINVITKSPLYRQKRSVTGLIGLYDAQKVSLDATGPFAPGSAFAYRVIGSLQDSRRYWDEEARLRGKVLAPMFAWRLSDRTQLQVKLIAAEHWIFREPLLIIDPSVTAATDDPGLAPGISKRGLNGIQPWSHVGTHTADLFTQLTTSVNQNISLRFAANGRYYFEDSEQEFLSTPSLTNRYNPYTGELTQNQTWALDAATNKYVPTYSAFFNPNAIPVRADAQWSRRKTANAQADIVGSYTFPFFSTQTVAGVAYSRQTGYTHGKNGTLPAIDLAHPDARYNPVYGSALNTFNKSSFTNWQLYVNERVGLFKDRLFLTAGVLRFNTKTTGQNALTNSAPSVLDDGKNMSSVGALVKVLPNVSVYYSHSSNSSPTIANNLPLWRDGKQDEYGFKSEFLNQRLSFNGAYFEITQTNVTIPNPDHQTDPAAPEQLIADYGNEGFEFELIGSLTPHLSAVATYSHLRMRDSLGRNVRGVADNLAALLLNYRYTDGGLKGLALSAGVNCTGKRAGDTPVNFTAANVVGQTSFYLKPMYAITLGASYRWHEKYFFRLTIDNPFDDKGYISVAGGRVSGTGITTAPGTNVKFSTTFEF